MLGVLGTQIKRKFPLSFVIAYASIAFVLLFKAAFAISSPNDLESVINPSNFID
jgi:hypothetical protein